MGQYAEVQEFVRKARREASSLGCLQCGKRLPQGMFLKGLPTLSEMARGGNQVEEIREAIHERGWYCRKCSNRFDQAGTATTTVCSDGKSTREKAVDKLRTPGGIEPVLRADYPDTPEGQEAWLNEINRRTEEKAKNLS